MTQVTRIQLNEPVSLDYKAEIERRLHFVSADLIDFEIYTHNDWVEAVDITVPVHKAPGDFKEKIQFMISNEVLSQKIIPPKIIWQSDNKESEFFDVFGSLVKDEIAYIAGEGQVGIGEPLISLMDYFDLRLKKIAEETFDAKEYRYPTLIQTDTLHKCGYFDSFPQFLMFVTRLHNDLDTYQEFIADYQEQDDIRPFGLKHCKNLDYCLPPTMCFHTYHQYEGQTLGNRVVTSKGKSFRFESKYHRTLERLWDFTIREIVFLGSRDFVSMCRQEYMELALKFVQELGLKGHCEVANDPFFCDQDGAGKMLNQRIQELKYELRLNISTDETIAVGSFNFHDHFFGERFQIRQDDTQFAYSGCVGFGLERLVYAFLCQKGLDQKNWSQVTEMMYGLIP